MLFFMSLVPELTSGQNISPVSCARIQLLCPATLVVPTVVHFLSSSFDC